MYFIVQSLQYFEHLKENPQGCKLCVMELTNQAHK